MLLCCLSLGDDHWRGILCQLLPPVPFDRVGLMSVGHNGNMVMEKKSIIALL